MPATVYQADLPHARQLISQWLAANLDAKAMAWLHEKTVSFENAKPLRDFQLAFGLAPRMVGKRPLLLTDRHLQQARDLRPGLDPARWTTDQAARILLLLMLPHEDEGGFVDTINQFFTAADVGELTALSLALPLLPHPEALLPRASEGIRTSMDVVFNAIALHNPYPMVYMTEAAWNQMILKAVFIGSPLDKITGLDQRANPVLARIMRDYAHERWAAGRAVAPMLWRVVAPFVNDHALPDLARLFESGSTETEQQAAALACWQSNLPAAMQLLQTQRLDLAEKISAGELDWANLDQG